MSMVGPRPELDEFVDLHADDYGEILAVPPGVTGPTQLRFAGVEARMLHLHHDPEAFYRDELLPDKVEMDLDYARSHSNREDLRVLCQTLILPLILLLARPAARGLAGRSEERRSSWPARRWSSRSCRSLFAIGLGSPR